MSEAPFQLRCAEIAAGVSAIEVVGELDMATAPELANAINSVAQNGTRRVIVDLSDVSFLDSSALNALIHGERDLALRGTEFRIVSPADHVVRKVFEITLLTERLHVVETVDDALA